MLLIPHAVDAGIMMDQFLQVPFNEKLHTILERQEELASRIQLPALVRYTIYGLLSSVCNLFCFFWCIRGWNLLKEEKAKANSAAAEPDFEFRLAELMEIGLAEPQEVSIAPLSRR